MRRFHLLDRHWSETNHGDTRFSLNGSILALALGTDPFFSLRFRLKPA